MTVKVCFDRLSNSASNVLPANCWCAVPSSYTARSTTQLSLKPRRIIIKKKEKESEDHFGGSIHQDDMPVSIEDDLSDRVKVESMQALVQVKHRVGSESADSSSSSSRLKKKRRSGRR